MKKRIDTGQLVRGMYVAELDRPWLETPFLFQGFEITSDEELEQLRQHCKHVYVDTELSSPNVLPQIHAVPVSPSNTVDFDPVTDKKIEFEILKKSVAPRQAQAYEDQTTLEEEVERIQGTFLETRSLIMQIMEDAKLGKTIKVDSAKRAVASMAESVIRNPDALVCFSQLKHADAYTAEHSLRVSILALVFGRHLGMNKEQLHLLGTGGLLHDIGKMKIPTEILNKPGELSAAEAKFMEEHVPLGVKILEEAGGLPAPVLEVTRGHHERYDGSGYKFGLRGDAIGQFGLIGGIVDFYDAVTSDRVYRKGLPSHIMLREMYKLRSRSFHPQLVEQFIQCIGVYPIGSVVELNTGDIGVVTTINRERRLKPRITLVMQPNSHPYPEPRLIDLTQDRPVEGGPYEIRAVVEEHKYKINPANYLPVASSQ